MEDAIRLIVLDPAIHDDAPLSCSIVQRRRSEQDQTYSAVSYAWGKPEFSRHLNMRCGDSPSYLRITPNVEDLMRRLRAPGEPRYLWIDAICLNQADELEKAQQVPLMGCIYEEARDVHIWLGPENPMTAELFTFFREVCRLPESGKTEMSDRIGSLLKGILGGHNIMKGIRHIMGFSLYGLGSHAAGLSRRLALLAKPLSTAAVVPFLCHVLPWPQHGSRNLTCQRTE